MSRFGKSWILGLALVAGLGVSPPVFARDFGHGGKCELLTVEVDQADKKIILSGRNLINRGEPTVRFNGVDLPVVSFEAAQIIADLTVELAEVQKSYLLELVRGRFDFRRCPQFMVTVVPEAVPGPDKIVFVTSEQFTGDLGGVSGANDICNRLATAANRDGTFVAWLSTSVVNAVDALPADGGPWFNTNGDAVAQDISDLTDGSIANPIVYDEGGNPLPGGSTPLVWTGTNQSGLKRPDGFCGDWQNGSTGLGFVGSAIATDATWTEREFSQNCSDTTKRLYCFEE